MGIIEGISDGLSSFAKLGGAFYADGLPRRKPIALIGYLITAFATAAFGSGDRSLACSARPRHSVAGTRSSHAGSEGVVGCCSGSFCIWTFLRLRASDGHARRYRWSAQRSLAISRIPGTIPLDFCTYTPAGIGSGGLNWFRRPGKGASACTK